MKKIHLVAFDKNPIRFLAYGFILFFAILTFNAVYFSMLNAPASVFSEANTEKVKLAIIIDDFGESRAGVKEMMEIDKPLTFAIMPFLTHSTEDAEEAYKKGHEVIIHLAMEPKVGKASWLGPRPIMAATGEDEIIKIVTDAYENIPHAMGANIHMGSKASGSELVMNTVLNVVGAHNGYFVDSKTSDKHVPNRLALEKGIPCVENNVFLDSTQSKSKIKSQLKKAISYAVNNKFAVAIGHVGPDGGVVTAQAIREMLPEFEENGVELVYVSDLILSKYDNAKSKNMEN